MPMTSREVPPHFIVIVPGYMGSKLRDRMTGEIVWVDSSTIPWNPLQWRGWLDWLMKTMTYPNDNLEAVGIMDEVVFVPPWAKQEHYNRLVNALLGMGYKADAAQCFGYAGGQQPFDERSLNCYAFAYDWRQDNRLSARQLGEAIARWRSYHEGAPAWIIAHSNGGLVARWYIEKEGGKESVGRLFLMGSPWDGTPKAMHMAFSGLDTLFRRSFNWFNIPERTRNLLRTFPSIYQLIPHVNPFLRDAGNENVSPFTNNEWLEDARLRELLKSGQLFNEELGTKLSVETLCFFGTRHLTPTSGRLSFAAANSWSGIVWDETEEGDGTIPVRSAVHPKAQEKVPYPVSHGDIYVNDAVLEKLKFELMDKYRLTRAAVVTSNLKIVFEPDKDIYAPGEAVNLWVTVHEQDNSRPVSRANIRVQLTWQQALPGSQPEVLPRPLPEIRLVEKEAGRYEGSLLAPDVEGYYELRCLVKTARLREFTLEELIAVEAALDPLVFDASG
jgi:pimeloyl-ACP methyl ester carboxylesterase